MIHFQIRRTVEGNWLAWPTSGGEIVGPCSSLDVLFHLLACNYASFALELRWP